ncbi:alpha/beta hydrolase [candidate division KSB1 bacterium]|nr:alpha/beta hydrolase [candidate division KSB1 bacterium]
MKRNRESIYKISDQNKNTHDFDEFCHSGTSVNERFVEVSHTVALRVITFSPALKYFSLPVVMVPGLTSVMLSFKRILLELTRHYVVHYIETREKSSSILKKRDDFSVRSIGMDVIKVISHLNLADRKYIHLAMSLGATAAVECFKYMKQKPYCFILLEPNAVFDVPKWGRYILPLIAPFYCLFKPAIKWYMKNFRIDAEQDPESYRITSRALDAADPYKLKDTVLALSTYEIWDRLSHLDIPTLIISASKDTLHRYNDIRRIVSGIKNCAYRNLFVHQRTHSGELVDVMREYVEGLKK